MVEAPDPCLISHESWQEGGRDYESHTITDFDQEVMFFSYCMMKKLANISVNFEKEINTI